MAGNNYDISQYGLGEPSVIIIQPFTHVSKDTMASLPEELHRATGATFLFCQFDVQSPDDDLTPWPAPAMFGKHPFGGKAAGTLKYITDELLPGINGEKKLPVILGGYSLGGLFALWCAYQTDAFDSVAAVSPSLWYDSWIDYVAHNRPLARHIYLSLGLAESNGKNQRLSVVGDNMRRQDELLEGISHTLEWNDGNHFTDPAGRMLRGYEWTIKSLQ